MTNVSTMGKATTIKKTFSRETTIRQIIQSDASIIWSLLTNAADFARWNSTIISIEGDIELGKKIKLKSVLDPKRTFKLKIKTLISEQQLVWGDAMGNRTYTLQSTDNGQVLFEMTEKIGGLMFPLFASQIPSFDASFEQFASDLKQEAETIFNATA